MRVVIAKIVPTNQLSPRDACGSTAYKLEKIVDHMLNRVAQDAPGPSYLWSRRQDQDEDFLSISHVFASIRERKEIGC